MDRPDSLLELHREVVEALTLAKLPTKTYPGVPVGDTLLYKGMAHVTAGPSRVWFYEDANGRTWQEAPGGSDADRERHFAIDLRLADHPGGEPNSHVVITELLGLPAPTTPSTTCRGETIPANVIPLPGRLVIHERLERIASTVGGAAGQNIVLDFMPEPAPDFVSTPPRAGVDARLFGPSVSPPGSGAARLTGNEPRIVWELTREEQLCVVRSTIGRLLVVKMGSEDAVLNDIAAKLAAGVAPALAGAGDGGTSMTSILPNDDDLPPDQVGVPVGPECATGAKAIEIDARVKRWSRPATSEPQESLVIQFRTVEGLPDDSLLPDSILAARELELVGFSRAGWAIERSVRCTQMKSLCLSESDFEPDEGCRLARSVDIVVGDSDGTLKRFAAAIVPQPGDPDQGLLRIGGRAQGETFFYDWWMEFEIDFRLEVGPAPRDPAEGELSERSGTLDEITIGIDQLYAERCAGGGRSREDIDKDIKALMEERNLPPQTMGVKPVAVRTWQQGDAEPTLAGYLIGLAVVAAITILSGGAGFGFSAGVIFTFFVLGVAAGAGAIGAVDSFVLDAGLRDKLNEFVTENSEQPGEPGPLARFQPVQVELRRNEQDAYALNAYFDELPERMRVQWYAPDIPVGQGGDPDYVAEWIAGQLPGGTMWRLTVPDAARHITDGWLKLVVEDPTSPSGEADVHVATSSRGRRYLRTDPDAAGANNLRELPPPPG
jgi:hypothetical protein